MGVLGLIPARGGSKGIPGKNLADVGGRPLIAWTIAAARESGVIDRVVVSTDSSEIASAGRAHGAEASFLRPAALARDDTPMLPVVQHAIETLSADGFAIDIIVLLQPTSPFRTAGDIAECVALHRRARRPVVSVRVVKLHPGWMFSFDDAGVLRRHETGELTGRRQDLPQLVAPNGAVYVSTAEALRGGQDFFSNALGYLMPAERSLDIDEPFDLILARAVAAGILADRRVHA